MLISLEVSGITDVSMLDAQSIEPWQEELPKRWVESIKLNE
jgi:hypothetical protein